MKRNILIVQGHPDPSGQHFGHALAERYAAAARDAGHTVRQITVAGLHLPYVTTRSQWISRTALPAIMSAQQDVAWANHLVFIYPLWLGDMPAILKSFLEHLSCGGFVMETKPDGTWQRKLMGKSARIFVTMGMPTIAYRLFYFSHSLKSLERNILKFAGVSPVRSSIIGSIEGTAAHRERWLATAANLGTAAR